MSDGNNGDNLQWSSIVEKTLLQTRSDKLMCMRKLFDLLGVKEYRLREMIIRMIQKPDERKELEKHIEWWETSYYISGFIKRYPQCPNNGSADPHYDMYYSGDTAFEHECDMTTALMAFLEKDPIPDGLYDSEDAESSDGE